MMLEGVAKGGKAAGGAVNLESTETERKREDWWCEVCALLLPLCVFLLLFVVLKMHFVPS